MKEEEEMKQGKRKRQEQKEEEKTWKQHGCLMTAALQIQTSVEIDFSHGMHVQEEGAAGDWIENKAGWEMECRVQRTMKMRCHGGRRRARQTRK